jgi:hypothetical protein
MTSILLWDEGWPVGRHEVSDFGLWWGGARHRSERQNFRPIWATVGATQKATAQLPLASQAVRLRPARMAVGYSPLRAAGLW